MDSQKELSQILGISQGLRGEGETTWAEIYTEIGRLQERAMQNNKISPCGLPHYPQQGDSSLSKPSSGLLGGRNY